MGRGSFIRRNWRISCKRSLNSNSLVEISCYFESRHEGRSFHGYQGIAISWDIAKLTSLVLHSTLSHPFPGICWWGKVGRITRLFSPTLFHQRFSWDRCESRTWIRATADVAFTHRLKRLEFRSSCIKLCISMCHYHVTICVSICMSVYMSLSNLGIRWNPILLKKTSSSEGHLLILVSTDKI